MISTMTAGISPAAMKDMASWPSENPGPDVAVMARLPVEAAPATILKADTSVSAWIMVTPLSGGWLAKYSITSLEGVIG
ncbi:hypothetical protein SDC9_155757 [bioreactor metagenome]|uniref:Uncharacterized protein n=1 Tax=bioreactor metagenome TaxID=1076179 RepID=A0A645F2D1_9ZZZZ